MLMGSASGGKEFAAFSTPAKPKPVAPSVTPYTGAPAPQRPGSPVSAGTPTGGTLTTPEMKAAISSAMGSVKDMMVVVPSGKRSEYIPDKAISMFKQKPVGPSVADAAAIALKQAQDAMAAAGLVIPQGATSGWVGTPPVPAPASAPGSAPLTYGVSPATGSPLTVDEGGTPVIDPATPPVGMWGAMPMPMKVAVIGGGSAIVIYIVYRLSRRGGGPTKS